MWGITPRTWPCYWAISTIQKIGFPEGLSYMNLCDRILEWYIIHCWINKRSRKKKERPLIFFLIEFWYAGDWSRALHKLSLYSTTDPHPNPVIHLSCSSVSKPLPIMWEAMRSIPALRGKWYRCVFVGFGKWTDKDAVLDIDIVAQEDGTLLFPFWNCLYICSPWFPTTCREGTWSRAGKN